MSYKDSAEMTEEEKQEYINKTLALLHQFLTDASPNKHAMLLMLDEDDHLLQTYNFNTNPSLAIMMLGSSMEMIRDEVQEGMVQRLLN